MKHRSLMLILIGLGLTMAALAAELQVTRDGSSGRVVAVQVKGEAATPGGKGLSREAARATALDFLAEHGELWGLKDPASQLVLVPDDLRGAAHPRFVQVEQGLPVLGAELNVHLNAAGRVYAVTGKLSPDLSGTTPTIDEEEALAIGLANWQADFLSFDEPDILEANLLLLDEGLLNTDGLGRTHLLGKSAWVQLQLPAMRASTWMPAMEN